MAEIVRKARPSPASTLLPPATCRHSGLVAGEDLADCDFVYIKAADGRVWKASGAAADAAALTVGIVGFAKAGEPCTPMFGLDVEYGTGLTPGARLYVSGTVPGGLADAASLGGTVPVAYAVDATRIRVFPATR